MQSLSQDISLMEMDNDTIQELIAGYAIGALDEAEMAQAEMLLETSAEARQLLAEFEAVTTGLALSVDPVEMPEGSLERLRLKAGIDPTATIAPEPARTQPRFVSIEGGAANFNQKPAAPRKTFWQGNTLAAYAAAFVLFVTTAVFGIMLLNTNTKLSQAEQDRAKIAAILATPNLKVADLAPNGPTNTSGNVKVYIDAASNKVYLVAQNMTSLPDNKEYEAWLIAGDTGPQKAGLLGTGPGKDTAIFELTPTRPVNQYMRVALTIENKGGAATPTVPPVMVGTIPL